MSKKYKRAFLTGCDEKTEWMLPWFVDNYKKHNDTPMIFADFGVSEEMIDYVNDNFHARMKFKDRSQLRGWFLKPLAMMTSPSIETVWIDTDCEILGDISGIFGHLKNEKLSMVQDEPWTRRTKEIWHNSGVVGFRNKPQILRAWYEEVLQSPIYGDQEVLHSILNPLSREVYIDSLPQEYNWLRLQIIDGKENKNVKVMHWTGQKGKDHIRSLIDD